MVATSQTLSPVDHVVEPNARIAIDQLGIVMTNAGIGSSGTITAGAFNGTVGATTPAAGTFTTLVTTGLLELSTAAGLTAHSGGGQGSATPLTGGMNQVTTVAGANDSVLLPVSAAGMVVAVVNATATNSMNVFPAASETINALTGGTAFGVAAGKTVIFICALAGKWYSVLTA